MTNFKALGIEKDMTAEFKNHADSDLKKIMDSEYFTHPHITKRREGQSYCTVEVISCDHKDWWYRDLIGMQFFCKIKFDNYNGKKSVREYIGVKLSGSKEIIFRGFEPKDVIII
jgi:hypothetical protein